MKIECIMKKKNLYLVTVLFAMFTIIYGINTGKRLTVSMSNIMLANVEALVFAEELPEVTIKCGTNEGPCWVREGAATCIDGWCTQNCKFSGSTQNGCIRRWRR